MTNKQPKQTDATRRAQVVLPKLAKPESSFADEVGKILAKKEVLFQSEENLVIEIINEPFSGERDKFKLARGGLKFQQMTPIRLRTWVEDYLETGMHGENGFTPKTMPEVTARALLVAPQLLKHLPKVTRILDVPVPIRQTNGDIIYPKPGINPELGIYCDPLCPTLERYSIEQAKEILEEAYQGFCWDSAQSQTNALARMLTPYARGLMGFGARWPLWFFEGNRPRCGKDYLNGVTQLVYLGHVFEDFALLGGKEESMKRILSALRSGRRMMHFANCQDSIADAAFIQAITAPVIRGRLLGGNSARNDLELPNEIDYSISANIGLTYREDLEPRMRKIGLAFYQENPNERAFPNPKLHDWVLTNRWQVLGAIAAHYHYWMEQGARDGLSLFSSFPQWAQVVGGVMVACGYGDPTRADPNIQAFSGGDLREKAMRALYERCFAARRGEVHTKGDIFKVIETEAPNDPRLEWFGDLTSPFPKEVQAARQKIGLALSAYHQRVLGGVKMVIDQHSANSHRWTYVFVEDKP